ncbi:hypothetical protein J4480_03915 [Candidatus Woesearchaeota archaeon]|nr:hypothetical protein [Candidatus Woesearchaeota archaeon]
MAKIEQMNEHVKPETVVELMRKSRFDSIRDKFDSVDAEADKKIINATPLDILAVTITLDNPVNVIDADIITPEEFLKEAFSKE